MIPNDQSPKAAQPKLAADRAFWFPLILLVTGGLMVGEATLSSRSLSDVARMGRHQGGALNGWRVLSIGLLLIAAGLVGFFSTPK